MRLYMASVREPIAGGKPYIKFTPHLDSLPAEANVVSTITLNEADYANLFDILAGLGGLIEVVGER